MRVAVMTLGTRGDVQPYVALAVGLLRAGYDVRLFTSRDFRAFVEGYGLAFHGMNVDARELFGGEFIREVLGGGGGVFAVMRRVTEVYHGLLAGMLGDMRAAVGWADVLVYAPLATPVCYLAALHEKPVCGAFIQHWTPTAEFPHPNFSKFGGRLPGWANRAMAWVMEAVLWYLNRPVVVNNWWPELGLQGRPLLPGGWWLAGQGRPVLNGFSRHVVPKPADWGSHIHVTGYWFLDRPPGWEPPAGLVKFLADGPPPVYVGFGSWPVPDPTRTARTVVEALAGRRAVLNPGWAGTGEAELPANVCVADGVPHDWLFPRVAAVVHHGGAGTTAAGLRAGVPSVLVPFDGDQFFWGRRVEQLKAGPRMVPHRTLTAGTLGAAIRRATTDPAIRDGAAKLGEKIRAEDGVAAAVAAFGRHFGGPSMACG